MRQGDWKLIWRTLLPTSVDLYNLAEDPYETNNLAAAHPDKVAAMQQRLNALGKEAAKPLALIYVAGVGSGTRQAAAWPPKAAKARPWSRMTDTRSPTKASAIPINLERDKTQCRSKRGSDRRQPVAVAIGAARGRR